MQEIGTFCGLAITINMPISQNIDCQYIAKQ